MGFPAYWRRSLDRNSGMADAPGSCVSLAHRRDAANALLVDGGHSDSGAVSKSGP